MSKSMRDISRNTWTPRDPVTLEAINTGSLQRIADACEDMAKGHVELTQDRDRWKRWHDEEKASRERRDRAIAGLRGVITRLRRKLKAQP